MVVVHSHSLLKSSHRLALVLICALGLVTAVPCGAQSLDDNQGPIEVDGAQKTPATPVEHESTTQTFQPKVGRKAAEKYMGPKVLGNESNGAETYRGVANVGDAHYLALHFGSFVSDNAYSWGGKASESNVGRWNMGVTYRVGAWVNSMDLTIRVDLSQYNLSEGRATKLSFLPLITFPDADSKFPLYFGAGIGPGVFITQISKESSLSLDYQLVGGIRFFDVIERTGFFLESGIKNQLFILSDGQFNGVFISVGTVFTF